MRQQQATARQQHRHGRETVTDAAARHASDATTHQNMGCNHNDNESTTQCTANASSQQYLWLNQNANETMA